MAIFSIWESHFPEQNADEGRALTDAIWRDMTAFRGYVSHEIIEDLDHPGHLLVVSEWTARDRADDVLREYSSHPDARRANELVSQPRARFVGHLVSR